MLVLAHQDGEARASQVRANSVGVHSAQRALELERYLSAAFAFRMFRAYVILKYAVVKPKVLVD